MKNVDVEFKPGVSELTKEALAGVLESSDVLQRLREWFDYSFAISVGEENGKVKLTLTGVDSGADIMTLADLSAFLQMDRQTLRQMTENRAQSRPNPIPFLKIGKSLRFKRTDILAWLDRSKDFAGANGAPTVPPLPFGKIKKEKTKGTGK